MTHEWKVGDRFNRTITVSTDYEITRIDEKFVYLSDGKNIVIWPLFYLDDVTPLIPATPEPQKLDVTKPVRRIWSGNTGRIVGKTLDGKRLVFEHDIGGMCIGPESDFENIPEPKIMGRREAFLGPDGELYWVSSWPGNHPIDILGRTWVEITEGDGMEES